MDSTGDSWMQLTVGSVLFTIILFSIGSVLDFSFHFTTGSFHFTIGPFHFTIMLFTIGSVHFTIGSFHFTIDSFHSSM